VLPEAKAEVAVRRLLSYWPVRKWRLRRVHFY